MGKSTKGGALVDTFEGDESGENEDKRQQESEDEDGVEEGSIGNMASCDLDLHQVNKPIVVAARYRDASHARREVKLHRRSRSPTAATTLPPPPQPQKDNDTPHAHTITFPLFRSQNHTPYPTLSVPRKIVQNNRSRLRFTFGLSFQFLSHGSINNEREGEKIWRKRKEREIFGSFFLVLFLFFYFYFHFLLTLCGAFPLVRSKISFSPKKL